MAKNIENQIYRGGGVIYSTPDVVIACIKNYHSTHSNYLSELNKSLIDLYILYYSFDLEVDEIASLANLDKRTVRKRLDTALLYSKKKKWFVNEVDKTLDYILYNAKIIYRATMNCKKFVHNEKHI